MKMSSMLFCLVGVVIICSVWVVRSMSKKRLLMSTGYECLKKDILSIEKVQRRVTKMIPSISALTYEERLKRTGLISLENRRLRADLLEVFKILKGFVKVNPATHFSMSDRRSRGHTLKLEKPRARLDLRKHFFSNRVIDEWNALPGHTVEATSTNMFKAALQRLPHGAFKSWKQLPAPRGHLTT